MSIVDQVLEHSPDAWSCILSEKTTVPSSNFIAHSSRQRNCPVSHTKSIFALTPPMHTIPVEDGASRLVRAIESMPGLIAMGQIDLCGRCTSYAPSPTGNSHVANLHDHGYWAPCALPEQPVDNIAEGSIDWGANWMNGTRLGLLPSPSTPTGNSLSRKALAWVALTVASTVP